MRHSFAAFHTTGSNVIHRLLLLLRGEREDPRRNKDSSILDADLESRSALTRSAKALR
jgi:hypothetical protein